MAALCLSLSSGDVWLLDKLLGQWIFQAAAFQSASPQHKEAAAHVLHLELKMLNGKKSSCMVRRLRGNNEVRSSSAP